MPDNIFHKHARELAGHPLAADLPAAAKVSLRPNWPWRRWGRYAFLGLTPFALVIAYLGAAASWHHIPVSSVLNRLHNLTQAEEQVNPVAGKDANRASDAGRQKLLEVLAGPYSEDELRMRLGLDPEAIKGADFIMRNTLLRDIINTTIQLEESQQLRLMANIQSGKAFAGDEAKVSANGRQNVLEAVRNSDASHYDLVRALMDPSWPGHEAVVAIVQKIIDHDIVVSRGAAGLLNKDKGLVAAIAKLGSSCSLESWKNCVTPSPLLRPKQKPHAAPAPSIPLASPLSLQPAPAPSSPVHKP